jgi:hypothetical protein
VRHVPNDRQLSSICVFLLLNNIILGFGSGQ